MNPPTREVFANIAPWMQVLFYVMIFASMAVLAWRVIYRFRVQSLGQPGGFTRNPAVWLKRLYTHALLQKKLPRRRFAGFMHLLIFSGFVVLTIGTTLLAIADWGPIYFHQGLYYLLYEFTMDTFGVALILGCLLAIYRRTLAKPRSLGQSFGDWWMIFLLLALSITGLVLEALRLHYTQVPAAHARWSSIGHLIQLTILPGVSIDTTQSLHLALWWFHAILVAAFFATLPVTKMLHIITGPINIAARPTRHIGALTPIAIETVEQTGRIGAQQITDFNFQQRLSLDACMECGRCEDACPAFASGKPLSPKKLITDLRRNMYESASATRGLASAPDDSSRLRLSGPEKGDGGRFLNSKNAGHQPPALHNQTILPETLWACTMCQACVYECPVLIGHVDLISDMRRHLVAEGKIEGPPAAAMRKLSSHSNPYGILNSQRLDWAAGLDVPVAQPDSNFDYLLWVGCSASFDPRAQKVARALVQLLQLAKINFAVLGTNERCTGDPARRLGDEFLFQEHATQNITTLNTHKVKKIITPCPHCANTLANEYPQFGGTFQVTHHSQFLADLISQGKLQPPAIEGPYTLHDPCYLARVLGVTDAPRSVLDTTSGGFRELKRCGDKTSCCGAGGGRMWFEEPPAQRVSTQRAKEVIDSKATTLATACPFCLNMMTDGLNSTTPTGSQPVAVFDIAELLINGQRQTPT